MGNFMKNCVFQPPRYPTYSWNSKLIVLATETCGHIPAYFIDRKADVTLLFSHGNAEDMGMIGSYFEEMATLWKINIFIYEYPGYGLSDGEVSENGIYESVEAAYKYLTDIHNISPEQIVAYGRSLGTAACCHLGALSPLRGLILQSPMLSILRIVLRLRISLPWDMFCNIYKIRHVACPIFIIHGKDDDIVPVYHGMDLFLSSKSAVMPYWVEGGKHNNLEDRNLFDLNFYIQEFLHYLDSISVPKKKSSANV
ncbi:putative alpha/beta hydrolase [Cardiosporidium cionae]|uniref:Alpha/beta hydrolase n=1 Tax=Cardiosporidium cionae TaxID=476202 RepID=A0ABQ7JCG1_9APIC|nr:putative alpha/beta hydrolase [Cardiosporidium cionae]|eukprot:KAF8821666.1 putative alpha/beta hydrolase [Cardiosporidium cionae]